MSKKEIYFKLSTLALLLVVVLHGWLIQLTSYDSGTWLEVKNTVSMSALIISIAGVAITVMTIRRSERRAFKYVSVAYILAFLLFTALSLLVIAISGVGFLG